MKSVFGKADIKIAFENTTLGFYYSFITPFSVGGQPFQIYHFSKNGYKASQSAAIPMTDIFANDIAMALLVIFAQVFVGIKTTGLSIDIGWRIASIVGLFCYMIIPLCIIFFSRMPKFFEKILKFGIRILYRLKIVRDEQKTFSNAFNKTLDYTKSFDYLTDKPLLLISVLLLSVVQRLGFCILPYLSIQTLGGNVMFVAGVVTSIIIISGVTFFPTPGNSGALEGLFYIIFSSLHQDYIFWAILIWRFFSYYIFIIIGFFVAIKNSPSKPKIQEKEQVQSE